MLTFSLGVALLELAYLIPLSELRMEGDEDEIYSARRVALSSASSISSGIT